MHFNKWFAIQGVLFSLLCTGTHAIEAPQASVHPILAAHQARWEPARIEHVVGPVYMATGFDMANMVFIEGDSSTIVIDWGLFANSTKQALAAYREHSDKPIKTLMLTHPHGDHYSGVGGLFPKGIPSDVAVIGPANKLIKTNNAFDLHPYFQGEMYRGLFLQLGALLPKGAAGNVGSGVGPPLNFGLVSGIPPFTHTLTKSESMTVDGIDFEFIYAPADVVEHFAVWLPQNEVLITGDLPSLAFFVTPRQEKTRDIDNMIDSTRMLAELPAKHTVYMHSPIIYRGKAGAEMLWNAHDYLKLVRDQTYRAINNNQSADDLIANFPMPARFANNPEMRDHYHAFEWMLRGLYTKKVGWFGGEMAQIVKPLAKAEASRMAKLAGGEEALWQAAQQAYKDEDFGWAVQLAAYLLRLHSDDRDYKQLKANAQRSLAYRSVSANERHFLLTDAMALEGKIKPTDIRLVAPSVRGDVLSLPIGTILDKYLGVRLRAEECLDFNDSIALEIIDNQERHTLTVRNGVALYTEGTAPNASAVVQLRAADFYDIFLGKISWQEVIDQQRVVLSGNADAFFTFINFFDW